MGNVFACGRGFEGQLGVRKAYKTASKPLYLDSFKNKPVDFIACGSHHSLAVTHKGELYGWGEATLGQIGLGKGIKKALIPTRIIRSDEKQQYDE